MRFPDAPDEVARGKDRPFPTIRVRRMKLRDALDELAKAYKYRWCIRDEAIVFQPHPTKQ